MLGTLLAADLFLFYVFWEVMLVPMYLLIGIWGGERRIYAAVKFFLFTMAGSLLMLVAILWMAWGLDPLLGHERLGDLEDARAVARGIRPLARRIGSRSGELASLRLYRRLHLSDEIAQQIAEPLVNSGSPSASSPSTNA